jgi:hypothetical protein
MEAGWGWNLGWESYGVCVAVEIDPLDTQQSRIVSTENSQLLKYKDDMPYTHLCSSLVLMASLTICSYFPACPATCLGYLPQTKSMISHNMQFFL